jgi:hypothetical protein
MALQYTYTDSFLKNRITEEIETRAIDDVATSGEYSSTWTERLVIIRAYILASLEHLAKPDDAYAAKIQFYRKEYDSCLINAKRAKAAEETDATLKPSILSMSIERA